MTVKSRERRTNLIANLLSKQGGAEDAGAIEEAADYEALADKASEVLDLSRDELPDHFGYCNDSFTVSTPKVSARK